jgi:pimeloyl-ACP methyl ester carboxylesterase
MARIYCNQGFVSRAHRSVEPGRAKREPGGTVRCRPATDGIAQSVEQRDRQRPPLDDQLGGHRMRDQEPLTSLADDVAANKRVLDLQQGPTLLVGHSYGGVVITDAGNAPNVVGLLYIAAIIPDNGESALSLLPQAPAANNDNDVARSIERAAKASAR